MLLLSLILIVLVSEAIENRVSMNNRRRKENGDFKHRSGKR